MTDLPRLLVTRRLPGAVTERTRNGYDARLASNGQVRRTETEDHPHAHARSWGRRALVGV